MTTSTVSSVFLDTNVIAYQFDFGAPRKQQAATALLGGNAHEFVVSTQVLLELYVVLTRNGDPPLPATEAEQVLASLSRLMVVGADVALVRRAAATARAHQLSIWDAMIVEAANEAGCEELWTEDLAVGSTVRSVRIVNPFA